MTATTHPDFNHQTDGFEVTGAFAGRVSGRTILVTGVNIDGIGYATCEALASQSPAHLVLTGRDPSKISTCITALAAKYPNVAYHSVTLDLSSPDSVHSAADTILNNSAIPPINLLINNAAVMNLPHRTLTPSNHELTFATNHLGHFLLTNLLLPSLIRASTTSPHGSVRIINITSLSPLFTPSIRWSDHNFSRVNNTLPQSEQPNYAVHRRWGVSDPENETYIPLEAYNQSKIANVLFSIALNRRLYSQHGILSFAAHPGVIKTELGRHTTATTFEAIAKMDITFKSRGQGSATGLVAALDGGLGLPKQEKGEDGKENWGVYFVDCQVSWDAERLVVEGSEAERLWGVSEGMVGQRFEW